MGKRRGGEFVRWQEEREGGIRLVAVVGRVGYLPGRYQQSRTQDGRLATPERPKAAASRTYQAPQGLSIKRAQIETNRH